MTPLPLPPDYVGPEQVYVVQAGPFVKIGTSYNVGARVRALLRESGATLTPAEVNRGDIRLLAVTRGSYAEEHALHRRFASARVKGEWFCITPEITAWVESLREQVPA